jgi:signal transduction histidine kinase
MALATSGMQRIVGKLSLRHRLLATEAAIAALSLLILAPAWVFYKAYNASMQEQLVFALAVIFTALAAGLVGFALAELLLGASFSAKAKARTAALSASNEQLKETIAALQADKLQAEAASKAKSDFLANMSHELRTPLNAIIGFSDLMKSQTLGPMGNRTYVDYAADINFSGTHLLEIINDILDVVRHESGKMELKEEVVDVEAVIDEARRLVAPQALQGKVELTWRAPPSALPSLFCDRVRLRQMLLNILSNAVKFTARGGRVEIAAELKDGLQLIVKDSGVGIKPEDIAHIMTPFGQVGSEYSRQGTGLGLTLTKALVERHGGRLTLISVPGVGTTVQLSFPGERVGRSPVDPDMAIGGGVPS